MKRLRKFLCLPSAKRRMLVRAALLLGVIRLGVRVLPFQTLRRLLAQVTQAPTEVRKIDRSFPDQVAWAVTVASQYVPGASTCLVRALAAQVLLARRNHLARLCLGVAKGDKGELQAHAWVESEGKVVIGGLARLERYTLLSTMDGGKL